MSSQEQEQKAPFRPGMEQDYNLLLTRILAILKENAALVQLVREWRVGEYPDPSLATEYPAVYVAMSRRPQAARTSMAAAGSVDSPAGHHIETEAYVVCLATGADAASAQIAAYNLTAQVRNTLLRNNRLALDGSDPLCGMLEVSETPRMVPQIGTPLEGTTIIDRVHNYRLDNPTP